MCAGSGQLSGQSGPYSEGSNRRDLAAGMTTHISRTCLGDRERISNAPHP